MSLKFSDWEMQELIELAFEKDANKTDYLVRRIKKKGNTDEENEAVMLLSRLNSSK